MLNFLPYFSYTTFYDKNGIIKSIKYLKLNDVFMHSDYFKKADLYAQYGDRKPQIVFVESNN